MPRCQRQSLTAILPDRLHRTHRHLLSDPTVRYQDLGPGFYDTRVNAERRKRNHVRQLEALGYKVTLQPAV